MKENEKQISIRFPVDLFNWISEQAKANNRSFNGQVIWLLQQLYTQEKGKK